MPSTIMSAVFKPICNVCLTDIEAGTQGCLLSCGHFICNGCWRGGQPSVCPHCGNRGPAAPLEDPPAEVRDYVQNPLAQLRTTGDVIMFQIDHFRSAARQACKALHQLRLQNAEEVRRREEAEQKVSTLRQRVGEAAAAPATGPGGAWTGTGFRGTGNTRRDGFQGECAGGGDAGSSPIGKFRERFFGTDIGACAGAGAAVDGNGRSVSTPSSKDSRHASQGCPGGGIDSLVFQDRGLSSSSSKPPIQQQQEQQEQHHQEQQQQHHQQQHQHHQHQKQQQQQQQQQHHHQQKQRAATSAISAIPGARLTATVSRLPGSSSSSSSSSSSRSNASGVRPSQAKMGFGGGTKRPLPLMAGDVVGCAAETKTGRTVGWPVAGRPALAAVTQINRPPSLIADSPMTRSTTPHPAPPPFPPLSLSSANGSPAIRQRRESGSVGAHHRPLRPTGQTAVLQRPKTPGRPRRPDSGSDGGGGRLGPGVQNLEIGWTGAATDGRMMLSPSLGQQHQRKPQTRAAELTEVRRPQTPGHGSSAGFSRGVNLAASTTPSRNSGAPGSLELTSSTPPAGFARAISTPPTAASPLLLGGARGTLKRPSSGSLLSFPKRPDSATGMERPKQMGTSNQRRAETPLQNQGRAGTPSTPFTASSSSPRLRKPQLPYTPRSGGPQAASTSAGGVGSVPFTPPSVRRLGIHIPPSPEAAGMFGLSATNGMKHA